MSSLDAAVDYVKHRTAVRTLKVVFEKDPVRLCRKCQQPYSSHRLAWRAKTQPCPFCLRPFPHSP